MQNQNYNQTVNDLEVIRQGYIDILSKQIRGEKPQSAFDLPLRKATSLKPSGIKFTTNADELAFSRKITPKNQSGAKQLIYGD